MLLRFTSRFRKNLKKYQHKKREKTAITKFLKILQTESIIDPKYQDHKLKGRYRDCREAHIFPNLLIIYRVFPKENRIILRDIGSHNEIF